MVYKGLSLTNFVLLFFFIGYIVFYTFHEIQTFDLLILTAANLVSV